MTNKPFDRFNKRLFQELLSPFGQVIPNMAVIGDERMIDVFFAPHYQILPEEEELGSLVSIVQQPALLEPYRSALTDDDVQTCFAEAVHGLCRFTAGKSYCSGDDSAEVVDFGG